MVNEINARKKAKKDDGEDFNECFHSKHVDLLALVLYKYTVN